MLQERRARRYERTHVHARNPIAPASSFSLGRTTLIESLYTLELIEEFPVGKIPQQISNGLCVLATLKPKNPASLLPYAEFTVNGEFDFSFIDEASGEREQRFTDPDDVTDEVAAAIEGKCDGDDISYEGRTWNYDATYNNWFEVFVYAKNEQGGYSEAETAIDESSRLDTPQEIKNALIDAILPHIEDLSGESTGDLISMLDVADDDATIDARLLRLISASLMKRFSVSVERSA